MVLRQPRWLWPSAGLLVALSRRPSIQADVAPSPDVAETVQNVRFVWGSCGCFGAHRALQQFAAAAQGLVGNSVPLRGWVAPRREHVRRQSEGRGVTGPAVSDSRLVSWPL
jgi:hypothetical protein